MTHWPSQWFDLPLAIFDTETTGKDPHTCRIIEVGITQMLRGEVVREFDWFVDPECQIPEEVVQLTHIQQSDVDGQPKLRDIAGDILEAFRGHGIVAYSIGFDRTVLTRELREAGLDWPSENPILDPLVFAQHFYPHQRNNLGAVAERLGISLEGAHRACNDAAATGKVFYAFRDRLPPELDALLIVQAEWERDNQARLQWRRPSGDAASNPLLAQKETSRGLSPAFLYGEEPDPLKAIYGAVPNFRRET